MRPVCSHFLLALTFLLVTWPIISFADRRLESPVGYYETTPGVVGETNRLCITGGPSNTYHVEIATIYCAIALSADCANARPRFANFSSTLRKGKLTFREKNTGCRIDIIVDREQALVSQNIKACMGKLPYGNASGLYLKKNSTVDDNACGP